MVTLSLGLVDVKKEISNYLEPVIFHFSSPLVLLTLSNALFQ